MRTRLRSILVFALAVALFAWFLDEADLSRVAEQIEDSRGGLVALALVPLAIAYLARTVRWQYLLQPVGRASFSMAFRATVIGFAATALLPARVGELLRPYLLARHEGFSVASTVATIVFERVLDVVAVIALLCVYLLVPGGGADLPSGRLGPLAASTAIAAVIALVLLAIMGTLARHPERVGRLVLCSERVLPKRIAHSLAALARTFSEGFGVIRDARALTLSILWSVPLWVGIALHAWLVTVAFGIAMPFQGAFLLQALLVIGVAVPTPGAVGGYHAMYRLGVTAFFGADKDTAVAAAIVAHATAFVPVIVVGFVFMIQSGVGIARWEQLAGAARQDERTS